MPLRAALQGQVQVSVCAATLCIFLRPADEQQDAASLHGSRIRLAAG
ncbi:MAG: hypothetical protein ACLTGT_02525 [Oscillospiraceae bacterium]